MPNYNYTQKVKDSSGYDTYYPKTTAAQVITNDDLQFISAAERLRWNAAADSSSPLYTTTSSGQNYYITTEITQYQNGMRFFVRFNAANTGAAPYLNAIDSTTANNRRIYLFASGTTNPEAGMIQANSIWLVEYVGTHANGRFTLVGAPFTRVSDLIAAEGSDTAPKTWSPAMVAHAVRNVPTTASTSDPLNIPTTPIPISRDASVRGNLERLQGQANLLKEQVNSKPGRINPDVTGAEAFNGDTLALGSYSHAEGTSERKENVILFNNIQFIEYNGITNLSYFEINVPPDDAWALSEQLEILVVSIDPETQEESIDTWMIRLDNLTNIGNGTYRFTFDGFWNYEYNTIGRLLYKRGFADYATASGYASHAEGIGTHAQAYASHAAGQKTIANEQCMTAIGRLNKVNSNNGSSWLASGDAFVIGNGSYVNETEESRSNSFRTTNDGRVYANVFNNSGADYAEYFEWLDGNPNNELRRATFVTLEGDKIRTATDADDYIIGVVSPAPGVVGNSDNGQYYHMFLRDEWGNYIYEDLEIPPITFRDTVIKEGYSEQRLKLNPDFDPEKPFVSRKDRPEWDAVGMLGQLLVIDDGTCEVNGYCKPNADGIATKSDSGYRVISKDEEHGLVKIIFR